MAYFLLRNNSNELISRDRSLVKTCYGIDTYDDNGQPTGGYVQFYYDDVQQGIAYGIGLQDDFILTYSPDSIIIHAPNVPVDVDTSNAKVRIITGTEAMSYQTKAEADKADSALMH